MRRQSTSRASGRASEHAGASERSRSGDARPGRGAFVARQRADTRHRRTALPANEGLAGAAPAGALVIPHPRLRANNAMKLAKGGWW